MRKIISKMLMIVSVSTFASCTAMDEIPGHMPGSVEKRVKKSPVIQPELPENQLAV